MLPIPPFRGTRNNHGNKVSSIPQVDFFYRGDLGSDRDSDISILTVDGRNPAPVDMANIPLIAGFHTCQAVQDFFHQQYFKHLRMFPTHSGSLFCC